MGHGTGVGEGRGEDTATNVAAGSGVAVCFTVCFFCVGIPCICTGAALMAIFKDSSLWGAGLGLIIVSSLFLVLGIVLVVLICTGCLGKGQVRQNGGVVHGGGVVVTTTATGNGIQGGQPNSPPAFGQVQPPPYNSVQEGQVVKPSEEIINLET